MWTMGMLCQSLSDGNGTSHGLHKWGPAFVEYLSGEKREAKRGEKGGWGGQRDYSLEGIVHDTRRRHGEL